MWSWKESWSQAAAVKPLDPPDPWGDRPLNLLERAAGGDPPPRSELLPLASGLSAYLEYERERLLADSAIVTAVPSRAPVINQALRQAAESGGFTVTCQVTGQKTGSWSQHTSSQQERFSRTVTDWSVDPDLVEGRMVLLLDDVWVTGVSVFTYARSLLAAGASAVRALVVVRNVPLRFPH